MKALNINLLRFFVFFTFFFIITDVESKTISSLTTKEYQTYSKEIPIYPNAQIYDLKQKLGLKMIAHITSDLNFEKIVTFYTNKMKKKGWKVLFPNTQEMEIWTQALNKDRTKPPVITVILNKEKTKINCNLMIGVVKDARLTNDLTIITIYLSEAMLE